MTWLSGVKANEATHIAPTHSESCPHWLQLHVKNSVGGRCVTTSSESTSLLPSGFVSGISIGGMMVTDGATVNDALSLGIWWVVLNVGVVWGEASEEELKLSGMSTCVLHRLVEQQT